MQLHEQHEKEYKLNCFFILKVANWLLLGRLQEEHMRDENKTPENDETLENSIITNKVKKVHFAFSVVDKKSHSAIGPTSPSSQKIRKPLDFARMQRKARQFLKEDKTEELKLYLKPYLSHELEEFYNKSSRRLFSWAISYAKTSQALIFLLLNVPRETILDTLMQDDFYFLKHFINVKSIIDHERGCTPEETKLISEKIKYVLELNDEKINSAIGAIISSDKVTENIKNCVKAAIKNKMK